MKENLKGRNNAKEKTIQKETCLLIVFLNGFLVLPIDMKICDDGPKFENLLSHPTKVQDSFMTEVPRHAAAFDSLIEALRKLVERTKGIRE